MKGTDNWFEVKTKFRGFYRHMVFLDDWNHAAASLLFRNRIRYKIREIWKRDGEKYQIVLCDIRRKDISKFSIAMEELKNKMLLIGNTDYEAFCERFMSDIAM